MIKLTACVIVKNEEKNLPSWFACTEAIADEIIVVDTGSTDATKDIVRAHGRAKLYEFPWTGDFSAAKNFALGKAHGNWIVFLDADETFRPASIPRVRPLLERLHPNVHVVGVVCRLVNVDPGNCMRFISGSVQLRLFRNLKTLRYTGRIHEALAVPKDRKLELVKEIEIVHTGYAEAIVKQKLARNLTLLQQKIAAQGGKTTARDERYLMDCYYGFGDDEKTLEHAEKALARCDRSPDTLSHIHKTRISVHIKDRKEEGRKEASVEEVLRVIDEAIADCPATADFPLMKGLYLFNHKRYLESEACIQKGFALRAQAPLDVEHLKDNTECYLPASWWTLGEIAHLRGDEEAAREDWLQALTVDRFHSKALVRLVPSLEQAGVGAADIIELLNGLYDAGSPEDADFLVKTLAAQGGPVYLYYASHAQHRNAASEFLAAGRYDAAAMAIADNLEWIYKSGIADALVQGTCPEDSQLPLLLPASYLCAWEKLAAGEADGKVEKAIGRIRKEKQQELEKGREDDGKEVAVP